MSLYYEVHVTIEWSNDVLNQLDGLKILAKRHGFHMGDLLLMKREEQRSHKDVFFTCRNERYVSAEKAMTDFCDALTGAGFSVIRYKIEDTLLDSKIDDKLGLLYRG